MNNLFIDIKHVKMIFKYLFFLFMKYFKSIILYNKYFIILHKRNASIITRYKSFKYFWTSIVDRGYRYPRFNKSIFPFLRNLIQKM